jgi:outer membrane immunogenic protein
MKRILAAAAAFGALACFPLSAQAADPIDPGYDWTGLYIGAQAGWAWLDPNSAAANLIQPNSNGLVGGGYAGYNLQFNNIVFGVEGDFNGTDLSDTEACFNPAFACNASSDWNASIRGRLGFAADRVLIFATGGYAIADYDGFTDNGTRFPDSKTLDGFAIGAGVEYAWTDNVLVRAEYRHEDFGSATMNYDVPYSVDPDIDMVLLGVSWKF